MAAMVRGARRTGTAAGGVREWAEGIHLSAKLGGRLHLIDSDSSLVGDHPAQPPLSLRHPLGQFRLERTDRVQGCDRPGPVGARSSADSSGRTGTSDRSPWDAALSRAAAFPVAVRGPNP
jgi:hypothetical protein